MKNRTALKSYFVTNNIPTEENFRELIDSSLNQEEDGVKKLPAGPIAMQAQGATEELLYFYKNFGDTNPSWKISQNPADTSGNKSSGLNISDATGASRLFIKSDNGNVGIGTNSPAAKLDVQGTVNVSNGITVASGNMTVSTGNVGIGTASSAAYKLEVNGKVKLGGFTTTDNDEDNVSWLRDGNTKWDECIVKSSAARDSFSKRAGFGIHMHESRRFAFYSTGWDQLMSIEGSTGRMYVKGNVGIGTKTPSIKLDVQGEIGITNKNNPNAPWDHLYFMHDGIGAYIRAGGAESGLLLQVGAGTESYGNQAYTTGAAIMPSGNVGIGTADPKTKLQVGNKVIDDNNFKYDSDSVYFIHQAQATDTVLRDPKTVLLLARQGLAGKTYGAGAAFNLSRFDNQGTDSRTRLDISLANRSFDVITNNVMTLLSNGYVGIGTTSPECPLHVIGSINKAIGQYGYLNKGVPISTSATPTAAGTGTTSDVSIIADHRIIATEFNAISDIRIKKDFNRSNPLKDLDRLNQINIVDFFYKDVITAGGRVQKGVLAQEIEQVFPEAVSTHTDFVPDIYAHPENTAIENRSLSVTMKEAHGLATGDMVRLITATASVEVAIKVINEETFIVPDWKEDAREVFVYGKKVADYRTVNYNSLFALGISAVQELCRQVQQLKKDLSGVQEKLSGVLMPAL